jgi:hypothetical protein
MIEIRLCAARDCYTVATATETLRYADGTTRTYRVCAEHTMREYADLGRWVNLDRVTRS